MHALHCGIFFLLSTSIRLENTTLLLVHVKYLYAMSMQIFHLAYCFLVQASEARLMFMGGSIKKIRVSNQMSSVLPNRRAISRFVRLLVKEWDSQRILSEHLFSAHPKVGATACDIGATVW